MARALWTGSLSFGLVNVPIQLLSAVQDLDLHFRQIHEKDAAPIEVKRWCSKEGREVSWEEVGRGIDASKGKQVVITDEELSLAEPRKTRTIDIEQFVDLADVDPILYDHPYWAVPGADNEGATRAYRLLVEVMAKTDRAALGRFVMRAKEHLAIVRARDGALSVTTMRFHDEVRPAKGIGAPTGKQAKPAPKELDEAVRLIEALGADWDPERYEDRYRRRLQKVVRDKRKGKTVTIEEPEEETAPVADLMAALEASMAAAKEKGKAKGKARARAKARA